MPFDRTRRTKDPLQAAEAAFKAATTKPLESTPKSPSLPQCQRACFFAHRSGTFLNISKRGGRSGKTGLMRSECRNKHPSGSHSGRMTLFPSYPSRAVQGRGAAQPDQTRRSRKVRGAHRPTCKVPFPRDAYKCA
jgi:hypothetical protein